MKPSIPKGTRDFSPVEMVRRNFIFKTIREVFEKYGYQPIETPAMEMIETLMGKYGNEGDKLIFKILNSGDFLSKARQAAAEAFSKHILSSDELKELYVKNEHYKIFEYAMLKSNEKNLIENVLDNSSILSEAEKIGLEISEKALRYDLTVPFARYVVQHQNEITFPFKRYQIQPVWRADKPQKGRYREFYQCDADVIGSNSLLNEVEIVQMIDDVYSKLGIPVTIKINNRKILTGIAELYNLKERFKDFVIALDKIDKIGIEGVEKELNEKGLSRIDIRTVLVRQSIAKGIKFSDDSDMALSDINNAFKKCNSEIGMKGIEEVISIANTVDETYKLNNPIEFDITLARGLEYYTGAIFEVKANDVQIGSICGGGRYDDLTGIFGLPNVSGVGISFGIDRIFDVMNELNLFDSIGLTASTTKVLLAHFGEEERKYCIGVASQLRSAGINTEIYPDITKKIAKQFDYANKKQIPFVIVIGGDEMKTGELTLKNMSSGEQTKMKVDEIVTQLK
ncbi:MAG: histidine--tRNA ligase [Bacteroidota bacterium]